MITRENLNMKKIAVGMHRLRFYPPYPAGGEIYLSNLGEQLARRCIVNVVTGYVSRMPCKEKNRIDLTIYRVPYLKNIGLAQSFFISSLVTFTYLKIANKLDIINVFSPITYPNSVKLFKKYLKIPIIMTMLGGFTPTDLTKNFYSKENFPADQFIAVSNSVKESLIKSKVESDKIKVIPNGVDAELFKPRNNHGQYIKKLVFIGGLAPNKGVHILIEAIAKVIKEFKDIECLIIGGWYSGYHQEYKNYLKSIVNNLELSKVVRFIGNVPYEDVIKYLNESYVLVLPSITMLNVQEGSPGVILEASAMEIPVIASDCGGNIEVVRHGKTGLLVSENDSQQLANAIIYLLENEEEAIKMGKNGRQFMLENFDWKIVADRIFRVYEEIIQEHRCNT